MSPAAPAADAIVVGSGPNGLAAAITLARAGLGVHLIEGAETPGGGCRTGELTLPGFRHDLCSAVHPLAASSPFFRSVDLAARGVTLCTPKVAFAHPLDGGRAAAVAGSVEETAGGLGPDGRAYRRLLAPLVRDMGLTLPEILAPIRSVPRHPLAMARFGVAGLLPAAMLARRFRTEEARALLAGVAAHSMLPLSAPVTSAFGLLLMMAAHSVGWPVVAGGSAGITSALVAELTALGGRVETGRWVASLDSLPRARVVLLDVTPRQLIALAGPRLPSRYRSALQGFRYGPGVCKVDWALSGPVPWAAPACREAGTVHLGGTLAEVARSEAEVNAGRLPERPYCIVAQPGVVDPTRAPEGSHTLWAYCHVPSGSPVDAAGLIEAQIERFAPGFRELILARSVRTAADMERHNPNYVGGDINSGAGTLTQTVLRPVPRWNPYRTAIAGVYLCSASTPPGGGVHGMCGTGAARAALADLRIGAAGWPASLAASRSRVRCPRRTSSIRS
ncbi:MAG TPA: NAD(P)/FAD-dependent oxidoreductase [Streptosporangiaceae bacterium]|nr:NAD(P)/FAD-dependent oxidoreductase [Streptosporangiaceae bacterium]